MALTYSRSTLLSFLISFTYLSIVKKSSKIFIISFLLAVSTFVLLPRMEGEGTKLERTSTIIAKIENYKESLTAFVKSPLIGRGYNNIAFIRQHKNDRSHAAFGFDSSLLTILTTTGIVGFIFFTFGLKSLFNTNLKVKTMLIAILIHSFFANSLLYPWILMLLIIG